MQGILKLACLVSLFAFLPFTALSGCNTATSLPDSEINKSVDEPRTIDGVDISSQAKITGYLLGSPLPGTPAVISALNEKLRKDLNAEMVINYISWGDVQSKYPLILAAGEDVDWVFTAQWAFYSQLAAKGAFLDITPELLEKYMPKHYELIRNTTALEESKINGRDYMIPTSTPDRKANVFIYREDLRKKYGIPGIKKFSDLEPYLNAIKENEPEMIPLEIGSSYDLQTPHLNLVYENYDITLDIIPTSSGGTGIVYCPLDQEGKLYYLSDEPIASAYKNAAYTIKSWYEKGYINKGAFANKVRSKESFVQGKSAVGLGNSIDIQGNIALATAQGFEVGLVPIVSGKSGHIVSDTYICNGIAIARNSKNTERTLMAMDLIMENREYDMLVYFGIEGKNYMEKDNKVVLLNESEKGSGSYPPDQAGFWFTNKDIFPPLASWTPSYIEHKEQLKTLLAPNIYAAFAPATDNIKIETENCNQIITQYLNPIQLGTVKDVDASFQVLKEKLRAAGIERIMAEMNRQTKAFLKNKQE